MNDKEIVLKEFFLEQGKNFYHLYHYIIHIIVLSFASKTFAKIFAKQKKHYQPA
jgi:hypothetical protein